MKDDKGHIRCKTIIEVLGKPREHVEASIKNYISHIKEDSELVILSEEFSEVREIDSIKTEHLGEKEQNKANGEMDSAAAVTEKGLQKNKKNSVLWSQFVELDIVIKGTQKLISFCFEYMPSSMEVVKPENFEMSSRELSNFLSDLQGRLHSVDMVVKQQKSENDFLKHNLNTIISNSIILSLKMAPMKLSHLSKMTGISDKEIGIFTQKLLSEKKIKKEGDVFSL